MLPSILRITRSSSTLIQQSLKSISTSTHRAQIIDKLDSDIAQTTNQGNIPKFEPLIEKKEFDRTRTVLPSREAWIESMNLGNSSTLGFISLHPDVFGQHPRLDFIQENVVWQNKMKQMSTTHAFNRAEVAGSNRKPWPQKGSGRARHSCRKAPQWVGGGVAHGPRRYTTHFYMLPFNKRVFGLISMLSGKYAQDDLKIVENLEIPTDDPSYIDRLCEEKLWGPSVLFVDESDIMPKNISIATHQIGHINLMPYYGLNVMGMLKHQTLVLTVAAAKKLQDVLYFQFNRPDLNRCNAEHKIPGITPTLYLDNCYHTKKE